MGGPQLQKHSKSLKSASTRICGDDQNMIHIIIGILIVTSISIIVIVGTFLSLAGRAHRSMKM